MRWIGRPAFPYGPAMVGVRAWARERDTGVSALVGATFLFSWGFPLTKSAGLPPEVFAFWRLLIGAAVLGGVLVVTRTRLDRGSAPPGAIVAAGLLFGVHQLVAVEAILRTSIAIVSLVVALQPLVVALVSRRVVHERVPPALVACAAVGVLSVMVVVQASLGDESRSLAGDLLAVVNLLLWTGYFLVAKRAREAGASALPFTAGTFSVAWLVMVPAVLVGGGVDSGGGHGLLLAAVVAIGPGHGHLLVNWAHTRVSAALSSLVLAGMPLLSGLWAHLVHHEPYGWRHVVGMLLMAAAIEGGRRAERAGAMDGVGGRDGFDEMEAPPV